MSPESERGNLVHEGNYIAHNGAYVSVVPGQQCACNCCDEWYIFTRDDNHSNHWQQTTDDLTCVQDDLCFDDLYPKYIAICANSFQPRSPGSTFDYVGGNNFDLINGPDVRFFDNFVYPEEGPDGRGVCGSQNLTRGDQSTLWQGPVFYHVPWYFQVNFSGTAWPMYEGWPRAIYSGTLTEGTIKTSQEIVEWNNNQVNGKEKIEYVYREPSTGEHNCENADCSNFYIYKREFEASPGAGAYIEIETHWGCRPLLCTGDYWDTQEDPRNPSSSYLYHLNASHVPCGYGCTEAIEVSIDGPNGGEFTWYMPHEISCTMGHFGGVRPSIFDNWLYNEDTGGISWDGSPIENAGEGELSFLGRITSSLNHMQDGPQGVCSHKIISDAITYLLPGYWDSPVPDYSDPIFLDPENIVSFPGGELDVGPLHQYFGYMDLAPPHCGCRTSNCVKESNPVSEGVYQLEPVPFRPYGGFRVFVDLEPQVGDGLKPFSLYLDYFEVPRLADEFIQEHSQRVVFDSNGNQYLVSVPYKVDLAAGNNPNHPVIRGMMPQLAETPMEELQLQDLSQVSVEFDFVCSQANPNPICLLSLNAVLQPGENVFESQRSITLQDGYEFAMQAKMVNDLFIIEVEVPYGLGKGTISKTIRLKCLSQKGCTFEEVDKEDLRGISINVVSVGHVA